MSLAAACKLFVCFILLRLATPNNHSYLDSDAPYQPVTETIPVISTETTSSLFLRDANSENLAKIEPDASFSGNIETDLSDVENPLYYCRLEQILEEWFKTMNESVDDPGQSPIPNETIVAEQDLLDLEAMFFAAEPDAVQAAATTMKPFIDSDFHNDQSELWNSMLSSDTFTALISRNAQSSGLQSAADLERLEHSQQKPITSNSTEAPLSSPLLSDVTAQLPLEPVDLSRNNRVSEDLSLIPSTEVDSKLVSTLLQRPTIDKLEADATCLHGSASGSGACSTSRSIDSELGPNSSLSMDSRESQGAAEGATVLNLVIVGSPVATNFVSNSSGKYILSRLPKRKPEIRTLLCYNLIPPVVNHVIIYKPSVTIPPHFTIKQPTSSKQPTKKTVNKPITFQPVPTQTSARTELAIATSGESVRTAQPSTSNSTKSTKRFTCGRCGKLFFTYIIFKKHLSSHNKKGEYRCNWPNCGIIEEGYKHLSRHYLEHLSGSDLSLCDICGKIYDCKSHLTSHMQSVHTKGEFCFQK
ncbi:unnamed protein product [Gongylonema pulchrum]|uniref:C2H2-type domain-containing protein n=1 Tax=Gongylonema pulchrum TaxID=637853 RepID=A0A183DTU9_9BILA|nr:unnamed protein product [Gongylonema pulchrum]